MKAFLGSIGRNFFELMDATSQLMGLWHRITKVVVQSIFQRKVLKREHVTHQMGLMGVDSLGIIVLLGSAIGTVLALQAAYQLKMFGAIMYTGGLVSVSMARELGPLSAAIVIAGRVGARLAAELGTMKVQEEIDALTVMGLNPIRYLIAPRFLALVFMLPCLTVIIVVAGMVGGFLIGTFGVGIDPYMYIEKSFEALVLKDLYSGLGKSIIFSILIALVRCHQGLSVQGGAEGVGKATTEAVVISIILIIVVDAVATAILYYALPA